MDPMQALVQLRGQAAAPIGPNQGIGGPQLGAPSATPAPVGAGAAPAAHPGVDGRGLTNGNQQDSLNAFARHAVRGGDIPTLIAHVTELQRMYPKLAVARHENGHAELVGPARDQFLAAAYARAKGAKVAHVRNAGTGQRLHLEF